MSPQLWVLKQVGQDGWGRHSEARMNTENEPSIYLFSCKRGANLTNAF